jgi:phage terminase large subunit
MLGAHASVFDPPRASVGAVVKPWKPVALAHDQWPPDYRAVYAWRIQQLTALRGDPELVRGAKEYYRTRKAEFIMHWMDTYNPRKVGTKWVPFVLFNRQLEFVQFIDELRADQENGLVEKCRDIGATWLACAYSVACYLLDGDDAIGWGSRKQELVDKLGDPDSIFEKMRLLIKRMPDIWLPEGFRPRDHATFMKLLNPENGATVTGESGDNIGRGGRKTIYWKDESAHYERPEKIEAALGDNTNVQVDISSVNGLGNVFHRRRESGVDWSPGAQIEKGQTRVFVFDWRDHPEKDQEWYDGRKAKAEREGMQHVFAQEVDRNYSAAVQNTIIAYEYITAAIDAHLKIPCLRVEPPNIWMAGLDVADSEGGDRNALALRQWVILRNVEEWGERDPGVTTRRTIASCRPHKGIKVQYDSIGIGSNVRSEFNRLVIDEKIITEADINFIAWNAGASVVNPYENIIPGDDQSLLNKDFFGNMKAQAWWSIRTRFYKTWRCIEAIKAGQPVPNYSADELISLDGSMPLLHQLMKELAQPTRGENGALKTIVNKKPDGTKSPNLADAVIQAFFPAPDHGGEAFTGAYG